MKASLLSLLLFCSLALVAQRYERKDLSEKKIGPVYCRFTQTTDSTGTYKIASLSFQNADYSMLSDIQSIIIQEDKTKAALVADIDALLTDLEKNGNLNTGFDRKQYSLSVDTKRMGKYLRLAAIKKTEVGYCYISRKQAKELREWLNAITIE